MSPKAGMFAACKEKPERDSCLRRLESRTPCNTKGDHAEGVDVERFYRCEAFEWSLSSLTETLEESQAYLNPSLTQPVW